jgi:haloacetate dehalogenase
VFTGFRRQMFEVGDGIRIHGVVGGSGPPLLLLHGYPQTHALWHKIAPELAKHFTVVATDLRGYGASSKPASSKPTSSKSASSKPASSKSAGRPDHAAYSKRAMAADQVAVMRQLGFERFKLCGHDRGGRVAHRLAADYPNSVEKLAVLDISPTLTMYEQTTMSFATVYYHWFFLIQPYPYPETMIGANPIAYLEQKIGSGSAGMTPFAPEALEAYRAAFTPETVHASCEDYRASATLDLEHDRQDRGADRRLTMPLLVLWGQNGAIERCFHPIEDWRAVARDVRGRALPGGHYLAEELPDQTLAALTEFFSDSASPV